MVPSYFHYPPFSHPAFERSENNCQGLKNLDLKDKARI